MFVPNTSWADANNTYEIIDQTTLDVLFTLSEVLSGMTPRPVLDATRKADARIALNDLMDYVAGGELPLNDAAARYLFELINSVQTALEEASTIGSIDLLRRVTELVGFLNMLADQLGDTGDNGTVADKLRKYAARVVPYAVVTVNTAFALLGAAADVKALTGG